MKDRVVLILVVVVAVLLGVGVTIKISGDAVVQRLVMQQSQILASQKKIERKIAGEDFDAGDQLDVLDTVGEVSGNVSARDKKIEQRLTSLERKVDDLIVALKKVQQPAKARPSLPADEYTKIHQIDLGTSSIKGPKNAPVTIVEFMDFQCPFCLRFHPVIEEILKTYPEKVNYVLKNFPLNFHPQAKPAAKAALAAKEQGKYWEMVELLLQNNKNLTDEKFEELAKSLGLNTEKFMKDYKEKDAEWEKLIQEDMALAQKVAVRGTPTFYINGRKTKARDLATFKKEIDEILNKKK